MFSYGVKRPRHWQNGRAVLSSCQLDVISEVAPGQTNSELYELAKLSANWRYYSDTYHVLLVQPSLWCMWAIPPLYHSCQACLVSLQGITIYSLMMHSLCTHLNEREYREKITRGRYLMTTVNISVSVIYR